MTHGRELSGTEMASMLEEWINANMNDTKALTAFSDHIVNRTHRTLQQGCMRLFMHTIAAWAGSGQYDDRNEATVQTARKIMALLGKDLFLPYI